MYRSPLAIPRIWTSRLRKTFPVPNPISIFVTTRCTPYRGLAELVAPPNRDRVAETHVRVHEQDEGRNRRPAQSKDDGKVRRVRQGQSGYGARRIELQSSRATRTAAMLKHKSSIALATKQQPETGKALRNKATTQRPAPENLSTVDPTTQLSREESVWRSTFTGQQSTQVESTKSIWRDRYSNLRYLNEPSSEIPAGARSRLKLDRGRAASFIKTLTMNSKVPFATQWEKIGQRSVSMQYSILVGSLALSAKNALTVMHCMKQPMDHFRITMDCAFLLRNARWEEIQADDTLTKRFWQRVFMLRNRQHWPTNRMRDSDLDLLLQNMSERGQLSLVSLYEKTYSDQPTPDKTLLDLVDHYTRLRAVDNALFCLGRVSSRLMQSKDKDVVRRCMNLLQLESVEQNGQAQSFKILPALLQLGLVPDDLVYDIVTQASINLKVPAVAWDIFRYAKQQDASLGPVTYLLLLKDSYLRRDTNALNDLLSVIQTRPDLYQHPPIVASMINLIRSISVYERGAGPAEALARMLSFYDKAYTRAPLGRIGLLTDEQAQHGDHALPEPTPQSLAFMVFSFIMVQQDVNVVDGVWQKVTDASSPGELDLLEARKYPVFYDGFLCFYAKQEKHIPKALSVLRYMLNDGQCLPGDISWSIVVNMFLRHGKDESAEHVRQMMLRRGVPVTEKAWSFTLENYPYTEIAQEVGAILRRQEGDEEKTAQSPPNDSTTAGDVEVTKAQSEDPLAQTTPLNSLWSNGPSLGSLLDLTDRQNAA